MTSHYLNQFSPNLPKLIYEIGLQQCWLINTLRPRQNGHHFADDTFKSIFVNENVRISIKFSLEFVLKGPINNIPALAQIMAWRRPGDKPLSEPVMASLLTHIYVTRPQWVKAGWLMHILISELDHHWIIYVGIQYIPRNMHTVLLCFALLWLRNHS